MEFPPDPTSSEQITNTPIAEQPISAVRKKTQPDFIVYALTGLIVSPLVFVMGMLLILGPLELYSVAWDFIFFIMKFAGGYIAILGAIFFSIAPGFNNPKLAIVIFLAALCLIPYGIFLYFL